MAIKQLIEKSGSWLRSKTQNLRSIGKIEDLPDFPEDILDERPYKRSFLAKSSVSDKQQSIEKLQLGFDNLLEQLKTINEHFAQQTDRHAQLMDKIDVLPDILENFPAALNTQKQVIESLTAQFEQGNVAESQFIEAVQSIPAETAKQTASLAQIADNLRSASQTHTQMQNSFTEFSKNLSNLNDSINSQTDGILQMSKTFSASDRHLKYLISIQSKRFAWVFFTAIGVCLFVILAFILTVILVK